MTRSPSWTVWGRLACEVKVPKAALVGDRFGAAKGMALGRIDLASRNECVEN